MLVAILAIPLAVAAICTLTRRERFMEAATVSGSAAVFILSLAVAVDVAVRRGMSALGSWLYADAVSAIALGVIAFVGLTAAVYSIGYLRANVAGIRGNVERARELSRYYALFNLFIFAMLMVPVSNSLGILWVAIEGTTLASLFLVAFYRTAEALEAAWKYVIVGSVGIALALFGTLGPDAHMASGRAQRSAEPCQRASFGRASQHRDVCHPSLSGAGRDCARCNVRTEPAARLRIAFARNCHRVHLAANEPQTPACVFQHRAHGHRPHRYRIRRRLRRQRRDLADDQPRPDQIDDVLCRGAVGADLRHQRHRSHQRRDPHDADYRTAASSRNVLADRLAAIWYLHQRADDFQRRLHRKRCLGVDPDARVARTGVRAIPRARYGNGLRRIAEHDRTAPLRPRRRCSYGIQPRHRAPPRSLRSGTTAWPHRAEHAHPEDMMIARRAAGNRAIVESDGSSFHRVFSEIANTPETRFGDLFATDDREDGGGFSVHAMFSIPTSPGWVEIDVALSDELPGFASLAMTYPALGWYEREIAEQFGIGVEGHPRLRRLTLPANWPRGYYPMRRDRAWNERTPFQEELDEIPALVEAPSGVVDYPLGPVRSGVVESAHYTLRTVGEELLDCALQLFYKHRGVEKRAEGLRLEH